MQNQAMAGFDLWVLIYFPHSRHSLHTLDFPSSPYLSGLVYSLSYSLGNKNKIYPVFGLEQAHSSLFQFSKEETMA